jgi:hypothetical protein
MRGGGRCNKVCHKKSIKKVTDMCSGRESQVGSIIVFDGNPVYVYGFSLCLFCKVGKECRCEGYYYFVLEKMDGKEFFDTNK